MRSAASLARCRLVLVNQVQIAECVDCRVVVGPCVGSVFLLDCSRCTISVAAKQIRLRDMKDCELRIFAPTHECAVVEVRYHLLPSKWSTGWSGRRLCGAWECSTSSDKGGARVCDVGQAHGTESGRVCGSGTMGGAGTRLLSCRLEYCVALRHLHPALLTHPPARPPSML